MLTRDGTAEPISRDQILRRERGQGNFQFPCSADRKQDWQPHPVDPYSCYMCEHTYIQSHNLHAFSQVFLRNFPTYFFRWTEAVGDVLRIFKSLVTLKTRLGTFFFPIESVTKFSEGKPASAPNVPETLPDNFTDNPLQRRENETGGPIHRLARHIFYVSTPPPPSNPNPPGQNAKTPT